MRKFEGAEDRPPSRMVRPRAACERRGSGRRPSRWHSGLDPVIFDQVPDGVCIAGPDDRIRQANVAFTRMLRRPLREIVGRTHLEIVHSQMGEDSDCPIARMERTRQRQNGRIQIGHRWYHVLANPLFDSRGRPAGAVHVFSDVTTLKQAEEALFGTNRVLMVLYLCDQVLVRSDDESSLLEDVCRIVVEKGGFRLAWVALVEGDGNDNLREAARASAEEPPGGGPDVAGEDPDDLRGLAHKALETRKPVVIRSLFHSQGGGGTAPGADGPPAASIVLPLVANGRAIGAMAVSANEADAFSERDVMMLTDLADDLAYGMEAIRTRRRLECAVEDLRVSEEKYETLVERSHDGIIVAQDGKLVFANSRVAEMVGLSVEGLIGRSITDYIAPEQVALVAGRYRARIAGEGPVSSYEVDLLVRGERLPVELSSSIILFQGAPAVMAFIRDISDRRAAERKLREGEERYRTTLDDMFEGCEIIGHDWRYIYANNAVCAHRGRAREELLGHTVTEAYPGIEATRLFARMRACMEDGIASRFENEFERPDGVKAWFEISMQPVPEGIFILSMDISERKKKDQELLESERRLREAFLRLRDVQEGTIGAIATMAELRDPYTSGHQRRVARVACGIAEEMSLAEDRIAGLATAGLLHDIGKIQIPSDILSKPGRLTPIELGMIRSHAQAGYQILRAIPFPWPVADIIVQHHERMDGSGYPAGLAGDDILIEARILGVADVLEAMASHRPYRAALGIEAALDEISKESGRLYDPEVAAACLRLFARGFKLDEDPA